ncbi:MAG: hypothetical protein V4611_02980 [Patescibacteria group bacterium]
MSRSKSEASEPYVRFKNRPDVKKTMGSIKDDLHTINEDFYGEPSFNGTVLFALDQSDPTLAASIASIEAPRVDPDRLWFVRENIDNRFVVVGSTALGRALELDHPSYFDSIMNPYEHSVYTIPVRNDIGEPIAALQLAVDKTDTKPLKAKDFDRYALSQQATVDRIGKKVAWLSSLTPSLPARMASKASVTPNGIAARWDVNRSTEYMYNPDIEADFEEYLDVLKLAIAEIVQSDEIVERFGPVLIGQGDGQNMIFRFPEYLTKAANDEEFVSLILKLQIEPIMDLIKAKHEEINNAFPFNPSISIAAGASFIRFDSLGDATGKTFWDLANKTKK